MGAGLAQPRLAGLSTTAEGLLALRWRPRHTVWMQQLWLLAAGLWSSPSNAGGSWITRDCLSGVLAGTLWLRPPQLHVSTQGCAVKLTTWQWICHETGAVMLRMPAIPGSFYWEGRC